MKACINCKWCDRKSMQVGPQQFAMVFVCNQPDLQDPVEGVPLPCHTVRSNENFCGIKGLKWKEKEKVAPNIDSSAPAEHKIIQL